MRFGPALVSLVIACVMPQAANGGTPLAIPLPTSPTIDDVISTTAQEGDGQGLLPGADLCRTASYRKISLPGDDAAHNDSYHEWWWWYGSLELSNGKKLGYMVLWESKPWARAQIVQYAVTNLSDGTFHHGADHLLGAPQPLANEFAVRAERVSASGGDGRDRLRLKVDGYELDLSLETVKPPVITGHRASFCNDSYLYSRVRMPTRGTLTRAGTVVPLKGTSHFDHSWGFSPAYLVANTTALSFELEDGRDVFVGVVRVRQDGDEYTLHLGYISDANGDVTILHRGDFTLRPTRFWRRDASCRYPVEWDVEVNGEHLHVSASLDNAEIRTTDPRTLALWPEWPAIWDGETIVSGDVRGKGWLDLTHYCAA